MTTLRAGPARRAHARKRAALDGAPYLNRELSWLDFNARVLHEVRDRRNPLLERVKFLAIFASNLDEFFQVRVAGLLDQVAAHLSTTSPEGRTATEQLAAIRERVQQLVAEHAALFEEIRVELVGHKIRIANWADVPQAHGSLRRRYEEEIFPVLTPLAVDPRHPFPYISGLSLSLAVTMIDPETAERRFARIKVPPVIPRFMEAGHGVFVPTEQVIAANLGSLFSGMEIVGAHAFRVTRDADFDIDEDEADDLLIAIEEELRRRRFGQAVRLEIDRAMPPQTRKVLMRGLALDEAAVYEVDGLVDLTGLYEIADLDRPELKVQPWIPIIPPRLVPADEALPPDVFSAIRASDILLHHPYESFTGSVQQFIHQAALDPAVLTIKQTLYRTSGDSPIVHDLIRAAELGKQVVVMVEIKARFDERANIEWARKLEQAGAHVVFGLVNLKTHAKVALVVRREASGLRRYVHIGTGNYNPKTARYYTDLGLLTCRPEVGADVTDLFNVLTGLSRQRSFRRLLVAPLTLRSRLMELIDREIDHARAGRTARVVLKVNAIVDPGIIAALYEASNAGVDVDLLCRGTCSLWPGVPGVSERIRVRSIIGIFLEHSRIYGFANGGEEEWYIGSADIMERNLDRRIEAVAPIEDEAARARITEIIDTMLADDRRSWQLGADAVWRRTEELQEHEGMIDTHQRLRERALAAESHAVLPHRLGTGSASGMSGANGLGGLIGGNGASPDGRS